MLAHVSNEYIVSESRKQKTCGNGYNNNGGLLVKVEKDASGVRNIK